MNCPKIVPKYLGVAIAIALTVCCMSHAAAADALRVDDLVVMVIDSVEVAATETGVIAEIAVREGNSVTAGQELGKLDDRESRLQEQLAGTQLEIATAKSENHLAADLAAKQLAHQQQLAKQQQVVLDIAGKKAENDVRVLASMKSEGVAKTELERANQSRREFVDSVSQSEIDGLRLQYERIQLETKQADFERQIDKLHVHAENEAAVAMDLSIEKSKIELEQAIADQHVQDLQLALHRQQYELARLAVAQHKIIAPIDGVVVEQLRGKGDWVKPGDSILRVLRLNRLRAEGYIDAQRIAELRANRAVTLSLDSTDSETIERSGRIVFISPEIDPVNNEARFWVEFDNPQLDILPGMRLNMSVPAP